MIWIAQIPQRQRSKSQPTDAGVVSSIERVIRMVLSDGLRMIGAGVVIGVIAALGLTRLMQTLLYSVGPRDPLTFVAAPLLLIVAAVAACALPARRASRLDPVETIRAE